MSKKCSNCKNLQQSVYMKLEDETLYTIWCKVGNIEDKNLIVQGIAGSGKTTVALHRIAFLLYQLERLSSNNILIFSPNNIFSKKNH